MYMKKLVSTFLIALLLISTGVFVAAEGVSAEGITTSSCVDETRTVTISGDSNQPEKTKATITVFYPDATLADIATLPKNEVIAYADEQGVNANGEFNFSFKLKPRDISGIYTVWVSLPGNPLFTSTFAYSNVTLAASALAATQNLDKTAEDLVVVLDEAAMAIDVAIGRRYYQHDDEQKLGDAAYLVANRPTDAEDLKTKFTNIVSAIDSVKQASKGEREEIKKLVEDEKNPMMISDEALAAYNALTDPQKKDDVIVIVAADAEKLIYPDHVSSAILAAVTEATKPKPEVVISSPSLSSSKKDSVSIGHLENQPVVEVPMEAADSFNDLDSVPWAKNAINIIAERGVINGRGDGNYYPNDPVKREEFVKILVSVFELRMTSQNTLPYQDVSPKDWCYEAIGIASQSGIVNGVREDYFGMGQPISRQDMAVMLQRALKHVGAIIAKTEESEVIYTDEEAIAEYAKDAVATFSANEILSGRDEGSFDPQATSSRAEVATVIYRIMYKLNLL